MKDGPRSWLNWRWHTWDKTIVGEWRDNVGKNFTYIDETMTDPHADDTMLPVPYVIGDPNYTRIATLGTGKRKIRIPFTPQERQEILSFKGRKCDQCNAKKLLEIHHINNDPSNNDINNLQVLCRECHMKVRAVQPEPDDERLH